MCRRAECKLWRDYHPTPTPRLLCSACALADQNANYIIAPNGSHRGTAGERVDTIGWLVPAVPDVRPNGAGGIPRGARFHSYASLPTAGREWWRDLPL